MNTESYDVRAARHLPWVPESGIQLRKAGVHFDAIRVADRLGRELADQLAQLTAGSPGPVIQQANGERFVYFLVPVGSTGHRRWPTDAQQLTGRKRLQRDSYVGVPALEGATWPLSWRYPPGVDDHLVHPLLLHLTLCVLVGWPPESP
ncbi:hypothetical protein ABZW18_20425 [Streptomyces sp. NPDC004647]|uniref:hypothetical protein n=1 Tax=Streptomyces sp. NPDC004647 TaxID=3154671 RepID=UPI0033AC9134